MRGKPLVRHDTQEAIRRGIAYVSEDRLSLGLAMAQPISANVTLAVLGRLSTRFGLVPERRRAATVARWTGDLGIKAADPAHLIGTLLIGTLSGGNQQRVALATQPSLLILDSPTVGVDIGAKDGICAIVRKLTADGIAVIMISDEIPEVFHHTDRVLIMREGLLSGEIVPRTNSEAELRQAVDS